MPHRELINSLQVSFYDGVGDLVHSLFFSRPSLSDPVESGHGVEKLAGFGMDLLDSVLEW